MGSAMNAMARSLSEGEIAGVLPDLAGMAPYPRSDAN